MSGNTLFAIFWLVVGAVIVTALLVPTPEERIELERIRSQQKKHPSCLTKEEVINALTKVNAVKAEWPAKEDMVFEEAAKKESIK